MRARAYNAEEEEEEGLLTAYNKSQKVGKHNALSGNTTLGTRGPVCGSEHYTSALRLALLYAYWHKGAQTPGGGRASGAPGVSVQIT